MVRCEAVTFSFPNTTSAAARTIAVTSGSLITAGRGAPMARSTVTPEAAATPSTIWRKRSDTISRTSGR